MIAWIRKLPRGYRFAVYALLFAVCFFLLSRRMSGPPPAATLGGGFSVHETVSPPGGGAKAWWASSRPEKSRAQAERLDQPWGRNPFLAARAPAPAAKEESDTSFVLSGIIRRGGNRVAIINHQFVREGDSILGGKVLVIDQDKVILQKAAEKITLRLGEA